MVRAVQGPTKGRHLSASHAHITSHTHPFPPFPLPPCLPTHIHTGVVITRIEGSAFRSRGGLPNRQFPQEPMYILLGLKISPDRWGNPDESVLPLDFEIDYVRLYQDVTDGRRARLQCSPDDHPTKEWIEGHHLDYGLPGASFVSITGKASTAAQQPHSCHSSHSSHSSHSGKQAPLTSPHPSLPLPIHKHTQTLSRPLYACSASSSPSQAHSSYAPYSSYSKPLPSAYLAVYVSSQLSGCNRRQPSSSHQSTSHSYSRFHSSPLYYPP